MKNLTPEQQAAYDKDESDFKQEVETLKLQALEVKTIFLNKKIIPFQTESTIEEKQIFISQIFIEAKSLLLFSDEIVLQKFKELKFGNQLLKWFVPIEEIIDELNRLRNIEGFYFFLTPFFNAIKFHLETSLIINILEYFGLDTTYNNIETNSFYKRFAEEYKRRKYHEKKNQISKMTPEDKFINDLIDGLEKQGKDKREVKNYLLKPLQGNTTPYFTLFDFHIDGISKRKAYLELFPLMKLIMKSSQPLTENEFLAQSVNGLFANYNDYKISYVQKIFRE